VIVNAALAAGIVDLAGLYLGVGMLFAVAFVVFGVGRIDPAAVKGTVGFRILILPGSALLWPLLARRWASRRRTPPAQHDAHADGARA
jgi:membrane protein implicated in regulation of membrane protease activity